MPKFHFLGGTTNLGRFGTVKRGDVLNLTDREAESILNNGPGGAIDPRFQPFKEGAKIDGAGLDLPEGYELYTREAQAAARQQAEDQRKRAEALNQAVNPRSGLAGAGAPGQPVAAPLGQGGPIRSVAAVPQPKAPNSESAPLKAGEKTPQQLEAEETARLQRLQEANASSDLENFRQMPKAELLDVVDEIRQGGTPINVNKNSSRAEILKAVLAAKGMHDPEIEGEGDPT
jgi:hypothetical protein